MVSQKASRGVAGERRGAHKGRRRGLPAQLARWHRTAGIAAAAFVALLALTGIALNHTATLGLDSRYVSSRALIAWYGIEIPARIVSYRVGEDWVSQLGERLYFNGREIAAAGTYPAPLVGAVRLPARIVIGVEGRLLVLDPEGTLVETLGGAHGVPAGMLALGVRGGRQLAVRAAHGDYLADEELLTWQEKKVIEADWAHSRETPTALRERIREAYRARLITLERLMRDLHSGRLFGRYGPLVMDLAALALLVLAASGAWMWWYRNRRSKGGSS